MQYLCQEGGRRTSGGRGGCCMLNAATKNERQTSGCFCRQVQGPRLNPSPPSPTTGDDASRNSLPMFFFFEQDKESETKMSRFLFFLEIILNKIEIRPFKK
jgi:hypothetical protein